MAEMDEKYGEMIRAGFERLEKRIGELDDRMRAMEMQNAGFAVPTGARVDAAWRRLDEHSAAIIQLERELRQLVATVNQLQQILKWLLGIATSLVAALLIALATGHLTIAMVP